MGGGAQKPLSVDDATIEELSVKASIPTLATLFQQAKDTGLIKPVQQYVGT